MAKPYQKSYLTHEIAKIPDESYFPTLNPPLYRAATTPFTSCADLKRKHKMDDDCHPVCVYGRIGNPTTFAMEKAFATLENGYKSFSYSSGLAAVVSCLLAFAKSQDHILMMNAVYPPTRTTVETTFKELQIETTFFSAQTAKDIHKLLRPNTSLVFLESPSSYTFEMLDINAIVKVAHDNGSIVMIDNTWATPLFFKPLDHGIDISIHSLTKYVCGHSDVIGGIATTSNKELYLKLRATSRRLGHHQSPDTAYTVLRGLRTLSSRMQAHEKNALIIAQWLKNHKDIKEVFFPPLPTDPYHDLWQTYFTGSSSIFSICLQESLCRTTFIDTLKIFLIGYSWGGYESLVAPGTLSRNSKIYPTDKIVRVHIGLENTEDLIQDLDCALKAAKSS